jgi:3-phenylpropionate/trans-cinnamate dioxygenase ferredoxin component
MKDWIAINTVESFDESPRQFIDKDNLHIAVCKLGDSYCAFESMCTHAMYELDEAPIEGNEIICPLHGARFCLKTGAVLAPPAYEDLRVFPVRVQDGIVEIEWD